MTTASLIIDDQSAFEKAINQVKIEYEYEGIYELEQPYEEWEEYKKINSKCSEDDTDILNCDVSDIVDKILENSNVFVESLPECQKLDTEYEDALEYSLEQVITDMKERCNEEELRAFAHSLSTLAIVETKQDSTALMSYNLALNMITVYDSVIRSQIIGEEMYFLTLAQDSFLHELSHMEQNYCPCNNLDHLAGFDNYVIQEAFASTNYSTSFESYPTESYLYRLFLNSYLFSNPEGMFTIQDDILHNDLKDLNELFAGDSKELYHVMSTMEFLSFEMNDDLDYYYEKLYGKKIEMQEREVIRREMYGDFSSSLLKNYTSHLLNYVKDKNIPLEDILYFYKWYLGQLEVLYQHYYITYQEDMNTHSEDYLVYLENITNVFFQILADEYQVSKNGIYNRFTSLSSTTEKEFNLEAYVPYHLLKTMNQDLKGELDVEESNFLYANEVLNLTNEKVYKKEK